VSTDYIFMLLTGDLRLDDLDEGEIAMSGDSHMDLQQSGTKALLN
jgi:hypothetical protein